MFLFITVFVGAQLVMARPLIETEVIRQPALNSTEFNYQILLSQFEEAPKCGGVLVDQDLILTSATCVLDFGGIKKFLEEAVLYGGGTSLLMGLGDVADAVIHPKYTVNPTAFDMALVKFVPDDKGPKVRPAMLEGNTTSGGETCIMTSWWAEPDTWPERLVWQAVSVVQCDPPEDRLLCFSDDSIEFNKNDLGSPVVCDGVLTGLIPHGGGKKAINLTSDLEWITEAKEELAKPTPPSDELEPEDQNMQYFIQILQKLENITSDKYEPDGLGHHFTQWSNQIVIPLNYVLFAMVIFFFVLLFFIILFTVVLVYYSRK